jgi:hypothetical protein
MATAPVAKAGQADEAVAPNSRSPSAALPPK